MSQTLKYRDFRKRIIRKLPCIVYFEHKLDPENIKVLKIMEKMKKLYPLVLCYVVKWSHKGIWDKEPNMKKNSDVVCFKNNKIHHIISVYSTSELHLLFKTVYNDSVINHLSSYNKVLLNNKFIDIFYIHKLFYINKHSYEILPKGKSYETITLFPYSVERPKRIISQSNQKCEMILEKDHLIFKNDLNLNKFEDSLTSNSVVYTKSQSFNTNYMYKSINRIKFNDFDTVNHDVNENTFSETEVQISNINSHKIDDNHGNMPSKLDHSNLSLDEHTIYNEKNKINTDKSGCVDPFKFNPSTMFSDHQPLETISDDVEDILLSCETDDLLNTSHMPANYIQNLLLSDFIDDFTIDHNTENSFKLNKHLNNSICLKYSEKESDNGDNKNNLLFSNKKSPNSKYIYKYPYNKKLKLKDNHESKTSTKNTSLLNKNRKINYNIKKYKNNLNICENTEKNNYFYSTSTKGIYPPTHPKRFDGKSQNEIINNISKKDIQHIHSPFINEFLYFIQQENISSPVNM